MSGVVLSVNIAVPTRSTAKDVGITGIVKRPVDHPVEVRAPGPKTTGLHSGLVGDQIFDVAHHGGDDQAVYAYAREDYDWWEAELERELPGGMFGDNLTISGVDVNGAVIGELWHIGSDLVLSPTSSRIPCATFQARMAEPRWVKRFTKENRTGAYLRVVSPGLVRAGDPIEVTDPTRARRDDRRVVPRAHVRQARHRGSDQAAFVGSNWASAICRPPSVS